MDVIREKSFAETNLELLGIDIFNPGGKSIVYSSSNWMGVINGTNYEGSRGKRSGKFLGLAESAVLLLAWNFGGRDLSTLPGSGSLGCIVVDVQPAVMLVEAVPVLLGFSGTNLKASVRNALYP